MPQIKCILIGQHQDSDSIISLTRAEYDALTSEQKNNGTIYVITDDPDSDYIGYTRTEADNKFQNKILKGTVTLSTTWAGSNPYTQNVSITGTTANTKVDIQFTAAQVQQLISDGVTALWAENNNGTITVYALDATPTIAMTLQCTLIEVKI